VRNAPLSELWHGSHYGLRADQPESPFSRWQPVKNGGRIAVEGTFAQQVHDWLIEQGEAPAPRGVREAA
jgi:hypothetical protein